MCGETTGSKGLADSLTGRVLVALRRIMRAIDLHSRFLADRYGMTGPQLVVLKELGRAGEISVGQLAKAVHLSHATVTGVLDRLAKHDLVQRRRTVADKRRVLVALTGPGIAILSDAPPLLQDHFTSEFNKLADWEQTQILSSLQRVVVMMEAKQLEATPILTAGPIDSSPQRTAASRDADTQPTESPLSHPPEVGRLGPSANQWSSGRNNEARNSARRGPRAPGKRAQASTPDAPTETGGGGPPA